MVDRAERSSPNTYHIIVSETELVLQTFDLRLYLFIFLNIIVWIVEQLLALLDGPLLVDAG